MTVDRQRIKADIIVIGSGAAGLCAALAAAERNASVHLIEATALVGGTTSFSGGLLWVPFNRFARSAGFDDDRETTETYLRACIGVRAEDPRWKTFLDTINPLVDWLQATTGLSLHLTRYPDSFGEWQAGRDCRHLGIDPVPTRRLGAWRSKLRIPPGPQTLLSLKDISEATRPIGAVSGAAMLKLAPRMLKRMALGERALGLGLVAALLYACLERRVSITTSMRVTELVRSAGRVTGVIAESAAGRIELEAGRAVILASGGFDWDVQAMEAHLPGPIIGTQTPPVNRGDSLRLAAGIGAALEYLDEAWLLPGALTPHIKPYEGERLGLWLVGDRLLPHQLWVNKAGNRFVNEGAQNAANSFYTHDQAGNPNLPCYSIIDSNFRDKYAVLGSIRPGKPAPDWLIQAPDLETLATKIAVPPRALRTTIERFNILAKAGRDTDFGRGDGAYERYFGDHNAPSPNLGPVEKPPFYAYPVLPSSVGTKGGARTDCAARVLDSAGEGVAGLYAAGNAASAYNGPITVAAGCTIPPALVGGFVAARSALD